MSKTKIKRYCFYNSDVKLQKNGKKKRKKKKKSNKSIWPKFIQFIGWKFVDIYRYIRYGRKFNEYGITMYCGRQGSGKTIGIVSYLEKMRKKFPKVMIMTNFGYKYENRPLTAWQEIIDIRNGDDGIIFVIDELGNEFSSQKYALFPEEIAAESRMQRKQKMKIVASNQVFTRTVKELREQCYEVVECKTWLGRWTFLKAFDAEDYNTVIDEPDKKMKLMRLWRSNFIQSDDFRKLYDTNRKIKKLKPLESQVKEENKRHITKLVQGL